MEETTRQGPAYRKEAESQMGENTGEEVRLDALVSRLHSEGVNKGKAEAEKILDDARLEAEQILRAARTEAEAKIKSAEAEATKLQQSATASVQQAARDTMLALTQNVRGLFTKALRGQTGDVLNDVDFLRELIMNLVRDWAEGKAVTVAVSPEMGQKLLALAETGVASMLAEGVEIRLNRTITNGFRIRKEGDEVAYDVSEATVTESFSAYLNPQLTKLLES